MALLFLFAGGILLSGYFITKQRNLPWQRRYRETGDARLNAFVSQHTPQSRYHLNAFTPTKDNILHPDVLANPSQFSIHEDRGTYGLPVSYTSAIKTQPPSRYYRFENQFL